MRAVLPVGAGSGPEARIGELPAPVAGAGEVIVAVRATALNHVDLLQLQGRYPPPPDASPIPGVEAAGEIVEMAAGVTGWAVGDRVAALLAGGGWAERVAVPAGQLIRIPVEWSWAEAGALPEVALTAWTNLVVEGELRPGERVLVSGASSGVGTYVVSMANALGATVIAAGRDRERLEQTRPLGAAATVLHDELPAGLAALGGPVNLVVDLVGGDVLPRLLASLAPRGRLALVGLMAGSNAALELGFLLRQRLVLRGSVLRTRSLDEKAALVAGFTSFAAERLARRELLPVVDRVFPFERIAEACRYLVRGRPLGKVVLTLSP